MRSATGTPLFRVGYEPDPWSWTPWEFAPSGGTFGGRWDDPDGTYRVVYAGASAFACYVEVPARFRPDAALISGRGAIIGCPEDEHYPTVAPGLVPRSWSTPRRLGEAELTGRFVDVQHFNSIAQLRLLFVQRALGLRLADFDGSAIRQYEPRILTQEVSLYLYRNSSPIYDGIYFESRHGNDLELYAIYERSATAGERVGRTRLLTNVLSSLVPTDSDDFNKALTLHHLGFA
jgi:hypothetical protein